MGSGEELKEFYESEIVVHYEYIYKFLFAATEDYFLALDIAQETMTKAWEKIHKLRKYSNIKYALRVIARNTLYNHLKKRKHRAELMTHSELDKISQTEEDGLIVLLKKEDRRTILKAIANLSEQRMQVILLRYYYRQSFKDVAKMININYNTVLSHHRNAIIALKKYLGSNRT